MGNSGRKYSSSGYCVDHIPEMNQDGATNHNEVKGVEVDADIPITIDGNMLFLIFFAIIVVISVAYYFYRQFKLGGTASERRIIRHNKQLHEMQMFQLQQSLMAPPQIAPPQMAHHLPSLPSSYIGYSNASTIPVVPIPQNNHGTSTNTSVIP